MNRVFLCIELLQYLSAKKIIKTNELADLLETNPRNIREYIKVLQESGYDITSTKGANGGYTLNEKCILPTLNLTADEVEVLKSSCNYLAKKSDFLDFNSYLKAISKVVSSKIELNTEELTIIDRFPLAMSREELYSRFVVFTKAMNESKKCLIVYLSAHNKEKKHIIHPYKVFVYNGSWFVLCWNETVNEFGYFKLNRIMSIEITEDLFVRYKYYNEADFLDEFGMKQNGDYYDVKLELRDLYTVVSERIYGKNQKITKIDDRTTILECSMQNKNMIKTFVLGFGAKVKVLEPEWLRESIAKEAEDIMKNNL